MNKKFIILIFIGIIFLCAIYIISNPAVEINSVSDFKVPASFEKTPEFKNGLNKTTTYITYTDSVGYFINIYKINNTNEDTVQDFLKNETYVDYANDIYIIYTVIPSENNTYLAIDFGDGTAYSFEVVKIKNTLYFILCDGKLDDRGQSAVGAFLNEINENNKITKDMIIPVKSNNVTN